MGSANYSQFMPPNSYIDVSNFASPKALADHLNDVGNNERKYNSYFEWKNKYKSERTHWKYFCNLCEKFNVDSSHKQYSVEQIKKWWFEDAHCHPFEW